MFLLNVKQPHFSFFNIIYMWKNWCSLCWIYDWKSFLLYRQRKKQILNFYFLWLLFTFFLVYLILWWCSSTSTARIEELIQEDQNVKRRRDRYQKQSSLLSKLTRQLSVHDNRATAASLSDGSAESGNIFFFLLWKSLSISVLFLTNRFTMMYSNFSILPHLLRAVTALQYQVVKY